MCQFLGLLCRHPHLGEPVDNHLRESRVELLQCLTDCGAELVKPQMQPERTRNLTHE